MVTDSSTISGFLFQLTPIPRFRKGNRKGEYNVTDTPTADYDEAMRRGT